MRGPRALEGLPREVAVLSAVAFTVAIGFGILAPALPVFAREFGVGRTAAGAVVSAFAFMRLVTALGAGRLVDRLGERRMLATGLAVVAVSTGLAGLAQTYEQLLVLRAAGGFGSSLFTVSAASLIARSVPITLRGRAYSLWYGGFLVGGIAGPAFGGVITSVSLRAPFFVYSAALVVAGGIAFRSLRHLPLVDRDDPAFADRIGLGTALRDPAYRAALAGSLADGWASFGVRIALIPIFVVESLDRDPIWIGVGFFMVAVINAALLVPAGSYADRVGRRPVLLVGCVLTATGMLALGLFQTLPGYLASTVVIGVGSGLLHVAPAAMIGDVSEGRGGTVVAAGQMAGDLGSVVGPLVAGQLADSASYGVAFGATAGIVAVAGVLAVLSPETRTRPGPHPPVQPVPQE